MWQLFSLTAIFSNTLEETIDKATMLSADTLDTIVAAWIRNIIVFLIACVAATLILGSFPALLFAMPIAIWGLLNAIQAISYTWILKHVEITAASVTFGLLPLIFLPIDLAIAQEHIAMSQILGVFLMVAGGLVFFVRRDLKHVLLTKRFIGALLGLLAFDALIIGSEGYIFKSYYGATGLSPSAFLVSGMFYMCIFLSFALVVQALRKGPDLSVTGFAQYARGSSIAKIADYSNSFFTLQALSIATVSQVSAMKVLHPFVLLIVAFLAQRTLGIELEEEFSDAALYQKVTGIVLLSIGTLLVA